MALATAVWRGDMDMEIKAGSELTGKALGMMSSVREPQNNGSLALTLCDY